MKESTKSQRFPNFFQEEICTMVAESGSPRVKQIGVLFNIEILQALNPSDRAYYSQVQI